MEKRDLKNYRINAMLLNLYYSNSFVGNLNFTNQGDLYQKCLDKIFNMDESLVNFTLSESVAVNTLLSVNILEKC